jgi:hypothetical protein
MVDTDHAAVKEGNLVQQGVVAGDPVQQVHRDEGNCNIPKKKIQNNEENQFPFIKNLESTKTCLFQNPFLLCE